MNENDKSNYSWYLTDIGVYEHFAESIKYLNKALAIIQDVKGHSELKFTIFSQLTQTYLYSGDISNAEKNTVKNNLRYNFKTFWLYDHVI